MFGFEGSGKTSSLRPLSSRYSVMPSTEVTFVCARQNKAVTKNTDRVKRKRMRISLSPEYSDSRAPAQRPGEQVQMIGRTSYSGGGPRPLILNERCFANNMHEILRNLGPGTRVLDVGSLTGSFPVECCPESVVARVDLEEPAPGTCEGFIQANAACLPFPDRCFDA